MKEKIVIDAPQGAKYLGEFMETLPNGVINKVDTGCGATALMLENEENVVICCPSRLLINSKVSQYPNGRCPYSLLGVVGGISEDDIKNYILKCIQNTHPTKIMVTYDSFHKVKKVIGEDILSYKIVVDEYQELLNAYGYRSKAIDRLLRDLKGITNVSYISATPIPYSFVPEEIKHVKQYEIKWQEPTNIKVFREPSNRPYEKVRKLIISHKMNKEDENKPKEFYFFINSVKTISSIIKGAGLTNEEVKVLCAKSDENQKNLGEIKISEVSDKNKPYTFCTSGVFYGADFYSESGLIIIVSDGRNKYTQLDVSTDIPQIAGRIRNDDNPFKNIIIHIYSKSISPLSEDKFNQYLKKNLDLAQDTIDVYNNLGDHQKHVILRKLNPDDKDELAVYNEETKCIEINWFKVAYLRYRFETIDSVYKSSKTIKEAYAENGFDVSEKEQWTYISEQFLEASSRQPLFKDIYLEYIEERAKFTMGKTDRAKQIELKYDFINNLYSYITPEEVKKLQYSVTNLKELLYSRLPDTEEAVKAELKKRIFVGERYPTIILKNILRLIYSMFKIKITPKVTTLEKYIEMKPVKLKDEEKGRANGFEITAFCYHFKAVLIRCIRGNQKEGVSS